MYYKLSAIELELLARDRRTILRQFQVNQETRRQALKPPILVVPYKTSDLICFITRDEEEDDTDSSQASSDDDTKDYTNLEKIQQFCRRFCTFIKGRFSRPESEVKVQDRSIKKHQKRLSSGAATRIPYPGLSEALRGASGTLLGTSLQLKNYQDSILGEIVPLLGTKCDVCVLSEETQVFRLVDAILESNLWPLGESEKGNDIEEVTEDEGLEDLEEVNKEVGEEVGEDFSGEVSEDEQEYEERKEKISPVAACNKTNHAPSLYQATSDNNIEATHFFINDSVCPRL